VRHTPGFITVAIAGLAAGLLLTLVRPVAAGVPCDRKWGTVPQQVEQAFEHGRIMPISSYDDDPFVADSGLECLEGTVLARTAEGDLYLQDHRVLILDESVIYREDAITGDFVAFAWNPWPLPVTNTDGSFRFPDEERFPLHRVLRDADGRIVLREGLQEWLPQDLHRGMNTAFEAAVSVRAAAEQWAGRPLLWGTEGRLEINTHAFIDFNAFYSPTARALYFGVVPYRLPGTTVIRMFEMATSWEIAAHEAGHALHHAFKPNRTATHTGYRAWSESFGDQLALWVALRDPGRVRSLLAATQGNLARSNTLGVLGEVLGALTGEGGGFRDAVNDTRVSTTSEEVHDRSQVLTGAAYRIFLSVYAQRRRQVGSLDKALQEAGEVMGTFLVRAADYTPENTMTLEDVAKAYLKVDKELFAGRYHARLVQEFTRRELVDASSVAEWLAHEAAVPNLRLQVRSSEQRLVELIQTNLDRLGIGPDFGLRLQSVVQDNRFRQTIVRVQLTLGRGSSAVPLDNHGILVFRENGTLADYHPPLPADVLVQARALSAIAEAGRLGLDRHGVPVSITRGADGQVTAEAQVMRGDGMRVWMDVFSLENPGGERREIIERGYGGAHHADRLRSAGIVLSADDLIE
jgi:hypothetical protein